MFWRSRNRCVSLLLSSKSCNEALDSSSLSESIRICRNASCAGICRVFFCFFFCLFFLRFSDNFSANHWSRPKWNLFESKLRIWCHSDWIYPKLGLDFGMECRLRVFLSLFLDYSVSHASILVSGPCLQWFSGENTCLRSLRC